MRLSQIMELFNPFENSFKKKILNITGSDEFVKELSKLKTSLDEESLIKLAELHNNLSLDDIVDVTYTLKSFIPSEQIKQIIDVVYENSNFTVFNDFFKESPKYLVQVLMRISKYSHFFHNHSGEPSFWGIDMTKKLLDEENGKTVTDALNILVQRASDFDTKYGHLIAKAYVRNSSSTVLLNSDEINKIIELTDLYFKKKNNDNLDLTLILILNNFKPDIKFEKYFKYLIRKKNDIVLKYVESFVDLDDWLDEDDFKNYLDYVISKTNPCLFFEKGVIRLWKEKGSDYVDELFEKIRNLDDGIKLFINGYRLISNLGEDNHNNLLKIAMVEGGLNYLKEVL